MSQTTSHEAITIFHKLTSKMAASAITKNSEKYERDNLSLCRELPNGFCQNMCRTDAFIECLM